MAQINLDDVAILCEVVRQGSFSGAARQMRVSPSHVSRRIAALEEALGARLIQRTTRKLSLTEEGAAYHLRVAPMIEELALAAEDVAEHAGAPKGLLRVAAPQPFGHMFVAGWAAELTRLHPDLRVELRYDTRMTDLVGEGVDAAIRLGRLKPSTLVATRLCEMPRYVVASPGYLAGAPDVAHPQDLCGHAVMAFRYDGYETTWRFRCEEELEERVSFAPRLTIPDGLSLKRLALEGEGVTLVPEWMVAQELRDGTLVRLLPGWDVTPTEHDASVWLVYPSRDHLPLKVRAFVDHIKGKFAGGVPWR